MQYNNEMVTIYVYLPEEAVDVWAPVNAEHVAEDVYRIIDDIPNGYPIREFEKDDVVRCRVQTLVEGIQPNDVLVAFEHVVRKDA